ncbi:hypothetical protein BN7_3636 [Wickerhamomyces ciferrii]|uniref:Uncharacterized protein n=1 Tax=Wickerhamomyces ciferrii (strain ATCC 14091 / BCRC 22168 / CBS 111 / JCM 3599 / NBRC 0793 / NRRL Y-1031 F-60-10) TaxID=1206466 RepID=K0KPH1_WICCF|nr:uncharacterized protein BN7_3636 [Wickerhamomyces ciferrii]CCH44077.1 hypothetical protein BN7_3636 [Wickerhamomyces ciferrii]
MSAINIKLIKSYIQLPFKGIHRLNDPMDQETLIEEDRVRKGWHMKQNPFHHRVKIVDGKAMEDPFDDSAAVEESPLLSESNDA